MEYTNISMTEVSGVQKMHNAIRKLYDSKPAVANAIKNNENVRSVLEEHGVSIKYADASEVAIYVHCNTADHMYFVLPDGMQAGEVSDEQLNAVIGAGAKLSTASSYGTFISCLGSLASSSSKEVKVGLGITQETPADS